VTRPALSGLENPVARHAARLGGLHRPWRLAAVVTLLLLASVGAGLLLQAFWQEWALYNLLRPALAERALAMTLLAQTLVVLPWAAARGAGLWRRLEVAGALDDYRRSRVGAPRIVLGVLGAALAPVLLLAGLSLAATLALAAAGLLPAAGVLGCHVLLTTQAMAYAALGAALAGRLRRAVLAVPVALGVLAASLGALWLVDANVRLLAAGPGGAAPWIYAVLLPNPVTAAGAALEADVLRFSWLYTRLRVHEYSFVYPPAWQTSLLYGLLAASLVAGAVRRLSRAASW
jgi:hypothetical protein